MNDGATAARIATAKRCGTIVAASSTVPASPTDIASADVPSTSTQVPRHLSAPFASTVFRLAPNGTLRAAINFGNAILAKRDAAGQPTGVSVDLARELARRLGVPVEFVTYESAGKVVDGLKDGAWDVAFLAIDPARAIDIAYTAPYVVIEGAYLVREGSQLAANDQVDRPQTRVVVARGSAYDLFLSRQLAQAALVRVPTSQEVVDRFVAQSLDVAAGVRQQLESDARRIPGLRLLPGCFMAINQAMGIPRGRDAALPWLREFVEQMKRSGFVSQSLARHRIEGVSLAPPAR